MGGVSVFRVFCLVRSEIFLPASGMIMSPVFFRASHRTEDKGDVGRRRYVFVGWSMSVVFVEFVGVSVTFSGVVGVLLRCVMY